MENTQNHTPEKTPERSWQAAFLTALRLTGNVSEACRSAGIKSRRSVYELREQSPDFRAEWDEALEEAADVLELEARRRAYHGVDEPVIFQGEQCGAWVDAEGNTVSKDTPGARLIPLTVKKYDTTLLIFLLKGVRPEKFRERVKVDQDVKGSLNHKVEVSVQDLVEARRQAQEYRQARLEGKGNGE
jgi:hypothetical protein